MADGTIRIQEDVTGKELDNTIVNGALYRQRVHIGGSALVDIIEPLNATPGASVYALPVRNIPSGVQPVSGTVDISTLPAITGTVAISGTVPVSATDLDIRNLSQAQDAVLIYGSDDGGTTKRVVKTDAAGVVATSATFSGAIDTELPDAAALADNAANPTAPAVGAFGMGWDGATWDRLASRGSVSDALGSVAAGALATIGFGFLYNGASWDRLRGDVTNGLDVDVTRVTGTVTVAGTVTANAGANLNTSELALESGGNLELAAASLIVIDDWDESDRAKVNLIPGVAGITGGAGAVATNTPRITHASDDPVTVSLAAVNTKTPALGQAAMAASQPVVIASNQTTVPTFRLNALVTVAYDYLSQAQGATTDTWTYKTGGSGGSTVATVTITYTATDKLTILNVART